MTEARRTEIIKAFLRYSFSDYHGWFEYAGLTATEHEICTEQEFNELVAWVKEG